MTKAPADLRSLARAHTELSVQTLAGIARNSTSDQARVSAAQALLDRGWGKAPQQHTGEDGRRHAARPHRRWLLANAVQAGRRLAGNEERQGSSRRALGARAGAD